MGPRPIGGAEGMRGRSHRNLKSSIASCQLWTKYLIQANVVQETINVQGVNKKTKKKLPDKQSQ
jgi:hypothetical protein